MVSQCYTAPPLTLQSLCQGFRVANWAEAQVERTVLDIYCLACGNVFNFNNGPAAVPAPRNLVFCIPHVLPTII